MAELEECIDSLGEQFYFVQFQVLTVLECLCEVTRVLRLGEPTLAASCDDPTISMCNCDRHVQFVHGASGMGLDLCFSTRG